MSVDCLSPLVAKKNLSVPPRGLRSCPLISSGLTAKGSDLGNGGGKGVGKGGRKLSYTAKVQGNSNLLVGKAYTAMLGLEPGMEFEIKLGRKSIRLFPVGGSDEEE